MIFGGSKEGIWKKGLNTSILPFLRVIVLEIFFFLSYKSCAGQPKLKKLLSWNAKQLYWSHTRHGSSPVNLLHIFWKSSLKNTSRLLLLILPISLAKLIEKNCFCQLFWRSEICSIFLQMQSFLIDW